MKGPSKKKISKDYDFIARWYDFLIYPFECILTKSSRKKLLSQARGKVLELAIGTGASLKWYGGNCEITGVDFSREMLKKAREKGKRLNLKARFILGDVENLKLKPKSFDTVVDTLGLCTYKNPIKVLKNMKKLCKPDGKILLLEHGKSSNGLIKSLQKLREKRHYKKTGCSLIKRPDDLVKKAGLNSIQIERSIFGTIYSITAKP